MSAKNLNNTNHRLNRSSRLRDRRFYELDIIYLHQLRRLRQIVWTAKSKREKASLAKSLAISAENIDTTRLNTDHTQKIH